MPSLVGSEMCIRRRLGGAWFPRPSSQQRPDLRQHLRALYIPCHDLIHDLLGAAMHHYLAAVRVLGGEVPRDLVDVGRVHAPALGRVGLGLLQLDELSEILIVQRVRLAEVPPRIELVVPDPPRRRALLEEEHHGLHAGALEGAAGAIEHGVQVAAFQHELPQAHRGIVAVERKVFLMTTPPRPPALSILMKCWRKRKAVSPVRMGKFCWTSLRSLPPKGGLASTTS